MVEAFGSDRLSRHNKDRVRVLEWLLDNYDNRFSGRTTLMAMAFIRIALKHRGQWIRVFDHHHYENNKVRMLDVIQKLLEQTKLPYRCNSDGFQVLSDLAMPVNKL